jgi:hypothetical protein
MMLRKGLVGAAITMLAMGCSAWADESTPPAGAYAQTAGDLALPQLTVDPLMADAATAADAGAAAAAPAPRAPLMAALDSVGLAKPLDALHLNLYGYVEMGYLYDFTVPRNAGPAKVVSRDQILFPGDYKNSFLLDQVDLTIERAIDASKGFDIGFKVEGFFGTDAFYTHSNGILDQNDKEFPPGGGNNQLDLEQAYITVGIPIGSGLTLQLGKFATYFGYETINPTTNNFYTHSYIFSFGIPFTQTGILGTYNITSNFALTAGVTRGFNQSTLDNNDVPDFFGEAVLTLGNLKFTGNLGIGAEQTDDNTDYTILPEIIITDKFSDQLNVAADLVYGDTAHFSQWAGAAVYAQYIFNKNFALNARGEVYYDGRGFTTGAAFFGIGDITYFEGTLGVAITPLPDNPWVGSFTIRPELRVDTANHDNLEGKYTQLTAAVDAFWKF